MGRIPGVKRLFRLPSTEGRVGGDVEDEIAFHVEERTRELTSRGMSAAAARAEALREFGDVGEARTELEAIGRRRLRNTRRSSWWSDLRQDVRYGVRALLRAPVFTGLAIVTLALGIGANAAVFGVVKSVLLDSLPYADADRLMRVYGSYEPALERGAISVGSMTDIRERQRSFSDMAAFATHIPDAVLGGADRPRMVTVNWVEPGLFRTLGVPAAFGRTFRPGEADPDTARVVVLTHSAFQRYFSGDRGLIGRDIEINGIPRTVIGVLPRGFVGPAGEADFYFSLDFTHWLADPVRVRRTHWLGVVGRLNPGVTPEAARLELEAIGADLAREYPDDNAGIGVQAMPIRDAMVGEVRMPLIVLMLSAALVLLIACANLAGALLSRAVSRRKEFAVRGALGAGRGRLVRQLLTESTLLALTGGAAGLLLAWVGLSAMEGLALTALPSHADLSLDGGAIAVTALLALVTGLAFGIAPALAIGRSDLQGTLRDESRGSSESRRARRTRGVLVAAQIALCVSLLAGAGLLARSLLAMTGADAGFDPRNVLVVTVQLPNRDYGSVEARLRFHEEYEERLRSLPGVLAVSNASELPTEIGSRSSFTIQGEPWPDGGAEPFVLEAAVSDDYFRTLRIPILEGRNFDAREHDDAPRSILISESMARRWWPNGDAVGSRIRIGPDLQSPLIEIIGVVGDVRNDPVRPDAEPITYWSHRQSTWNRVSFLVRTSGDPLALAAPAERELAALDPSLPLGRTTTLSAIVSDSFAERRLPVVLMTAFGALALLLASVGVYALFASMAAAREREFGVRMALGSRPAAIARLVLRQGGVWMAAGLLAGGVGVFLVSHLLRNLLFGVPPFDPVALGLAVGMLLACATLALLTPVRRATRVDPATAMRAQ